MITTCNCSPLFYTYLWLRCCIVLPSLRTRTAFPTTQFSYRIVIYQSFKSDRWQQTALTNAAPVKIDLALFTVIYSHGHQFIAALPITWRGAPLLAIVGAMSMNIFRLAGDMSHVFSIIVLLLRVRVAKNAQGTNKTDSFRQCFPMITVDRRAESPPIKLSRWRPYYYLRVVAKWHNANTYRVFSL
jgi:hypothetical protein